MRLFISTDFCLQQTRQKSADELAEMQKGIEDCKKKQEEVGDVRLQYQSEQTC